MTRKTILTKFFSFLVILCLLLSAAGCGSKTGTESDEKINYGDAVDTEDDDDADVSETTGGKQQTTSGGKTQGGSKSNIKVSETHQINEEAKKDFLSSVPKKLKGKEVKILIWWEPGIAEKAKMQKFTEATGIKIKWISSGGVQEYMQKLSSMKIQGNSPDLACIREYPNSIMQDYFEPLSYGKLDYSDKKIFDVDTMERFKFNGKLYGVQIKGSSMSIFNILLYNKEMFDKSGLDTPRKLWESGNWNWDTFTDLCVKIKDKLKCEAAVACEYHAHDFISTANTTYTKINNGKITNNMGDPKLLSAWTLINDLQDKYKVLNLGLNKTGFIAQKCPMFIYGNYSLQKGDFCDRDLKFKYDYAPLPSPKGEKLIIPTGLQMWGFPKGSKNAEAAAYALRYWWSSEFDEKGSERWVDQNAADFNNWLWEQPKCYELAGIVSYDGSYTEQRMWAELATCGTANVRSTLDKWSGVIDSNINALNKEFGQK